MKRQLRRAAVGLAVLAALGYGAWWWLLRSEWLREQLRARVILEIEKATGGKAELGRLDFDPSLLGASIERLTLHGSEPPGAEPLLRAERIEVGLKILSFLRRDVDVGRIVIEKPRIHVQMDAEGRTNLPSPAGPRPGGPGDPMRDILRLAADAFVIRDGEFSFDSKKYKFSVSGQKLQAAFAFDGKGPVYRGNVASDALLIEAGGLPRMPVDASASVTVEQDAVEFAEFRARSEASTVTGKGRIENFRSAHGVFDIALDTNLTETVRLLKAAAGSGRIQSAGRLVWDGGSKIRYEGDVRAPALDIAVNGFRMRQVAASAQVTATEKTAELTNVKVRSPEGNFVGKASLPDYAGYRVDGEISDLSLQTVFERTGNSGLTYTGQAGGTVQAEGNWKGALAAEGSLRVTPGQDGIPVEGTVAGRFDRTQNQLTLRDSYVTTPHARVDVSGTLRQTLRVKLSATDLGDLRPALVAAGVEGPLPVRLAQNGSVLFEGTVSGELHTPLIAGQFRALEVRWKDVQADAISSTVVASPDKLTLTRFSVTQGGATATGNGSIVLHKWRAAGTSVIDLHAEARNLNIGNLRRQAGVQEPVEGLLHATAHLQGTVDDPRGELQVDWFRPGYGDEYLDRIKATVNHGQNTLRITSLEAQRGKARLAASGAYSHTAGDWKNGTATGNYQLTGVELTDIPQVQAARKGIVGQVASSGKLAVRVTNGAAAITSIDAESRLTELAVDKRPYGELTVKATTPAAGQVSLTANGTLRGASVTGTSTWKLAPGYPGSAKLEFGQIPLAVLNELSPNPVAAEARPFVGGFRGSVEMFGPALDIERWKVAATLQDIVVRPSRRQTLPGKTTAQDFELRNDGPLQFTSEGRMVTIRAAKFTAKDTNLSASGTFSLAEKRPWDLKVDGKLNLAGLRAVVPDVVASGVATIQATVRGELANPQVFGALELKDATLNLEDLPNGLDKVKGRVLFDRRRATIENRLTAESGGGALALGGFIDFSGEDTFYRLQAEASRVRIRYPEGVSTVADANVTLSGTTERSLMAGTVTVLRSGFTPRTDLGSLLAESNSGENAPKEANKFLANMQIDVKVRTAPETQFTTSLTNDLQAEANLQLRGSGARPVALGRITISQGDINFFGNKYTIKRGEVSFYNPTKVEPTLDMDLDTRVRGVDVTVNFTGPIDKLNVSYRSDPPLQPSEIIALLTVGRSPTSSTVGSSQSAARGSFLESGANSLLGSAISAPISSQLQRFFGVSRIKIDPTIAGLEGTPQARVTVEQQVSKDVTVTFVTNLNRSQQQVVRLEWNLSKEWSLIALRDENGSFGMDFQVRKQVK